jgi:hypothetical protein
VFPIEDMLHRCLSLTGGNAIQVNSTPKDETVPTSVMIAPRGLRLEKNSTFVLKCQDRKLRDERIRSSLEE